MYTGRMFIVVDTITGNTVGGDFKGRAKAVDYANEHDPGCGRLWIKPLDND